MAGNQLKLTRVQLAAFLSDHQAIKQFEQLFATVDAIAPDFVNEVSIAAENAGSRAQEALDTLQRIANALEFLALAPNADILSVKIIELLEFLALTPPQNASGNLKDIRIGEPRNYTEWDSDGTMRFKGDATVWQDIDFPIIVRTIGPNIPTLTTMQGNITTPQWAVNDYNVCEAQELIHLWKEGSQFQWHVHFVTNGLDATDRYVNWEVEWYWVDVNGQVSATVTDTSGDMLIPANTPTLTMFAKQISVATIAAHIAGHVYARLRRVASTGAAPTNDPWCSMLQMHVECDTVGSRYLFTK